MQARTLGIILLLVLIIALLVGTLLDRPPPAVVAAVLGIVFGYLLGAIAEGEEPRQRRESSGPPKSKKGSYETDDRQ